MGRPFDAIGIFRAVFLVGAGCLLLVNWLGADHHDAVVTCTMIGNRVVCTSS